ncbi:ABC transporter ATP-binding protein [Paenibacillus oenotherae]|nr:ABC transporter ATP-binding protein [Paenibacillus oenotherae]
MSGEAAASMVQVWRWTLSFMKPYRRQLLLQLTLGVLLTACEMMVPKSLELFIDHVIPERNWSYFAGLLAAMAVMVALMLGMRAYRNLIERELREKAASDVQLALFRKLRELGFSYYEKHSTGDSLSLMNTEVSAMQTIYQRHWPELVRCSLYVLVIAVMLAILHAPLLLWTLPWAGLYAICGPLLERRSMLGVLRMTEERVAYGQSVYDSISAQAELRAHGRLNWDRQRVLQDLERYLRSWRRMTVPLWLRGVPRRIVVYGSALTMFAYGAVLVRDGFLSVGEFVAFALYYMIMIFNLTLVITIMTEIRVLMSQAGKLYRLAEQKAELTEAEHPVKLPAVKGHLAFDCVSFRYPSGKADIVRAFKLDVRPGEKVALVGESGGGKSTILKLLGRFYDPTEGRILLDGVDYKELSLRQIRESIGFVFQETYLFGTTIRDNIRFVKPDATDAEVAAAAKAAYLHTFIEGLPQGYETEVGERGYRLSGGQKQRIAIARMFLKNAAVIVLDEATSALDNHSEQEVVQALEALMREKTIVTVAHRLTTVRHYDRIVVLERGMAVEAGGFDELLRRRGALYRLVEGRADGSG